MVFAVVGHWLQPTWTRYTMLCLVFCFKRFRYWISILRFKFLLIQHIRSAARALLQDFCSEHKIRIPFSSADIYFIFHGQFYVYDEHSTEIIWYDVIDIHATCAYVRYMSSARSLCRRIVLSIVEWMNQTRNEHGLCLSESWRTKAKHVETFCNSGQATKNWLTTFKLKLFIPNDDSILPKKVRLSISFCSLYVIVIVHYIQLNHIRKETISY